jgi:hypothetical protein
MTNKDAIRRHLSGIKDTLDSLEYECETEIVGDDARHLLTDIQAALRAVNALDPDTIKSDYDIEPLAARARRIYASIRVLRGTLNRIEGHMETLSASLDAIESATEESRPDTDGQSI